MQAFIIVSVGIMGMLIGSFLNVVILRMGTGRGLGGRSACFSCNKTLKWYELFPVISFLVQRGRCNHCGSKISWQYPAVELITGLLCASVAYRFWENAPVLALLWMLIICLGMVITVYDIRHGMIPIYPLVVIGIIGIFIKGSVVGFLVVPLLFLVLWAVSRGKWIGFGDIEIMAVMGLTLGITGGISSVMLGFWIAAAVILPWMLFQKKQYKKIRHVPVPMGPFLLFAMYLVGVWGIDIVEWLALMV